LPYPSGASRLTTKRFGATSKRLTGIIPVTVNITLMFNWAGKISVKSGTFVGDVTRRIEWHDERFNSSTVNGYVDLKFPELSAIWHPHVTFQNVREFMRPMDFVGTVFENGTVRLEERFIHTFSSRMYFKEFPFDVQTLYIKIRTALFDAKSVVFSVQPDQDQYLPSDSPAFHYTDYFQKVSTTKKGLYAGYSVLNCNFLAHRLATHNLVIVFLPLLTINVAHIMAFMVSMKSDVRFTLTVTALVGTVMFVIVIAKIAPAVSYMTKLTFLLLVTIVAGLTNLSIQLFFRLGMYYIDLIKSEKVVLKDDKKKFKHATFGRSVSLKRDMSEAVLWCGLMVINMNNRVDWIRRLETTNDIIRVIFAAVTIGLCVYITFFF